MRPMKLKALSLLQIAQQIGEKSALHPIHAHVELIATSRRRNRVGSRLLLSRRVKREERDELPRFKIEAFQLLYSEFKMETCGRF